MAGTRTPSTWERYGWLAGLVFVVAVVVETAISVTLPINQNDSATKIAHEIDAHSTTVLVVMCFCVVYAAAFPVYLWKLFDRLREDDPPRTLGLLILVGGALMVALHATSDVGIYGLLGAKIASYSAQHDPGISYTLYLTTFAIDSVGDVFGSLFLFAAGAVALRTERLPRWLAWIALVAAVFLFLQGFGLGGVVANFGLVLDLIGFVLFLFFVAASSVIGLRRERANQPARRPPSA